MRATTIFRHAREGVELAAADFKMATNEHDAAFYQGLIEAYLDIADMQPVRALPMKQIWKICLFIQLFEALGRENYGPYNEIPLPRKVTS